MLNQSVALFKKLQLPMKISFSADLSKTPKAFHKAATIAIDFCFKVIQTNEGTSSPVQGCQSRSPLSS